MRDIPYEDGANDCHFPPVTKERLLLVSFDDIYSNLYWMIDEVRELEDLVYDLLLEQEEMIEEA